MSTGTYSAQPYTPPYIWTDSTSLSFEADQPANEVKSFHDIFERLLPGQQLSPDPGQFIPTTGANVNGSLVARGLLLSEDENEQRFGGLPIETFRSRMPPELFEVFARFAGLIPSNSNLDVVEVTELPGD